MYKQAKYLLAGDRGLVVEFGNAISYEINFKVRSFVLALENAAIPGLLECIPTYRSLLIIYNPLVWELKLLTARLRDIENNLDSFRLPNPNIYHLPVAYGGEFGPDFLYVCQYTGLAPEDVVRVHSSRAYLIYMLGFTPGFPYLGGMDERIAVPRLDTPRIKIPAGSVGIAGNQTGIYPLVSPGGWRLIGRTPVKLFDPAIEKPVLLNAGDYIRFFKVTPEEYRQIALDIEKGQYKVKTSQYALGEG